MQPGDECRTLLQRMDEAAAADAGTLDAVAKAGRAAFAAAAQGDFSGSRLAAGLASFSDIVTRRIVELTAAEHRLPAVPWCWLALGSEGRFEQTFLTDQDNGLVFSAADPREAEALRPLFLPFAQAVNERLDACGYAFCSGGVMAGNAQWCLSVEEWCARFAAWVRRPEPLALMNATIFFDFRSLYGEAALADELRACVLGLTRETPAFLQMMAANALQAEPPLGFRGEIAVPAGGLVDLKKSGARLFVDAARIFALAAGCPAVATRERLLAAGPAVGLPEGEAAAASTAFSQLLRLRLAAQAETMAAGGAPGHRVDPRRLNEFDRVLLREALRQARRLQQRLKLNYAL